MKCETDGIPKLTQLPKFAFQKINEKTLVVYDPYMAYTRGHVVSSVAVSLGVQEHTILFVGERKEYWILTVHETVMPRRLEPEQGTEFLAQRVHPKKVEVIRWESEP